MKTKTIILKLILLGLGLAILQECGLISARQNLKNCKFSVESVSLKGLSLAGAEVGLGVGIENTNASEVIMDRLEAVLFLAGKDLGLVRSKKRVEVPAGEKRIVELSINTTYSQLGSGLLSALKSGDEIPYRLQGTAYLEFPLLGEISVPIDIEDVIKKEK